MKKFEFNKPSTNKMEIKFQGMFEQQDAMAFINEYNMNVKGITPNNCEVLLDAVDLKVSPQEMIPLLEQCFILYKQTGFKKVSMKLGQSSVLKMQVKRVADKSGLTNYEIIG